MALNVTNLLHQKRVTRWRSGLGVPACEDEPSSTPSEAIDSYCWPFTALRGFCDNVFVVTLVSYVVYLCDFTLFNWLFTRVDVVSQHHKFGCAFLSFFSWESKIALFFFFLTFPYPVPVPWDVCDFYWLQLRITYKSGCDCTSRKKILRQQRREK